MEKTDGDYRFQYVPEYIIRNWKDRDGLVAYVTRKDSEVYTSPVADTFIEHMKKDVGEDALVSSDALSNTNLIDVVSRIVHADFSSLDDDVFWLSALLSHLFYSNPYGKGRIDFITHLYADELEGVRNSEEASAFITRHFSDSRSTRDLLMMREMSSIAFVYGFDLSAAVLEAPPEIDFALGMNPAFIFNPADNPIFGRTTMPLSGNGVCAILPLSPRYALCLYDSRCLRVRTTEGRALISVDDAVLFNTVMARSGISLVFSATEQYGDEYYSHLYESIGSDIMETKNPSFSFIRVLAAAFDIDYPEREYSEALLRYDSKYIAGKSDVITQDEFQNRIRYALSISARS